MNCCSFTVAAAAACWVLVSPLAAAEPDGESPISQLDREHWAFQPLHRFTVPVNKDEKAWALTPVDAFILHTLERKNIAPQPLAAKATLLRRLSFDLIGLPPTPAELAAFEADASPQAYEKTVDRLLASPRYGERWAQFWLDLARFAETDGFEHDKLRPQAWKYRDWVIGALNRDLPYDRFIALQVAGDELEPDNPAAAVATMFCVAGPDMPDINAQDLRRHNLLNEMTGTVGSVVMAMQFGCAQCHDHKYDPISQADFYRLRAFFDPAVEVKREQPVTALAESTAQPDASHLYLGGDLERPGMQVEPAFPRILNAENVVVPPPADEAKTSQRRLALAQWLTRGDHPLTARVMVNRLWLHHFGRGLSNSPSDFGVVGEEPSHPALLDWLATELVEHGWSLKHVQRLIVTSAVYRQQGLTAADYRVGVPPIAADLFASFPRQRLTAEALRDAMLAVSGQLSVATGGPGVMPPLAKEVEQTLLKNQWKVSENPADHTRRSIYVFARRNLRFPLFDAFDRADPNQTCAARHVSTTAPQALVMLNSRFSLDTARHLAGNGLRAGEGDMDRAFEHVCLAALSRPPSTSERAQCGEFITQQTKLLLDEGRPAKDLALPLPACTSLDNEQAAAFVDLCLAVLNTSEFVYID